MNYMKQVAEMLNIKLGEEFKAYFKLFPDDLFTFKLTEKGLELYTEMSNGDHKWQSCDGSEPLLADILTGEIEIKRSRNKNG